MQTKVFGPKLQLDNRSLSSFKAHTGFRLF